MDAMEKIFTGTLSARATSATFSSGATAAPRFDSLCPLLLIWSAEKRTCVSRSQPVIVALEF
jgi:hypothetical protein